MATHPLRVHHEPHRPCQIRRAGTEGVRLSFALGEVDEIGHEVALDLLTVCSIVLLRKSSGGLDLLTEAMQDVITRGTGTAASIGRPARADHRARSAPGGQAACRPFVPPGGAWISPPVRIRSPRGWPGGGDGTARSRDPGTARAGRHPNSRRINNFAKVSKYNRLNFQITCARLQREELCHSNPSSLRASPPLGMHSAAGGTCYKPSIMHGSICYLPFQ